MSVPRDGPLRRSEAVELRWGDVDLQEDRPALLHVRRSRRTRRPREPYSTLAVRPHGRCRRS